MNGNARRCTPVHHQRPLVQPGARTSPPAALTKLGCGAAGKVRTWFWNGPEMRASACRALRTHANKRVNNAIHKWMKKTPADHDCRDTVLVHTYQCYDSTCKHALKHRYIYHSHTHARTHRQHSSAAAECSRDTFGENVTSL